MIAQVVSSSLVHTMVVAIVVCAVVGVALVAIRANGFTVPDWAVKIFWIVVAAAVGVFAIRFLASMAW